MAASVTPSFHALRRGRMWKYVDLSASQTDTNAKNENKVIPSLGQSASSTATIISPATGVDGRPFGKPDDEGPTPEEQAASYRKSLLESRYGFQFLWNPESLSINTDLNLNVTPNTADIFSTVGQAYPSMETISISIVLDRTNDFACFRGLRDASVVDYKFSVLKPLVEQFYTPNRFGATPTSETLELRNLLRLGTVYDIEYLFKTINSNSVVKNISGRLTADNGFLTPNAIGFQLGPTNDSIAYMGWVSSVNVQHVAFTEDMIPLRSIVNLTFNVLTNGGA